MKDTKKTPRPVFRTDSPFAPPAASQLQQPQHDAVVQLLINALRLIGEYRASLPRPASKRSKKRKRTHEKPEHDRPEAEGASQTPRIQEDVLIGFNSVTRHLEELSGASREAIAGSEKAALPRHVAAVVLLRPLDDLIYSHLPTLCQTASLAHSEMPATRLVLLDPAVEKKFAAALSKTPSVSLLAVLEPREGETSTKGLIEYVRDNVQTVEVPWLKQAMEAKWLGTKVDIQ